VSVYVDKLVERGWRLGPNCHLLADGLDELNAFAARLGLRRAWLQRSRTGVPHYDLVAAKRALAVRLGAADDDRQAMECARRWKEQARK
jgi:hypothetical protein